VQLVSSQKTFAAGEQVVLELRNVRPTPPAGQIYALYVQVTSPIRATLRYDTFLKSSQFIHPEPPTDNSANLAVEENRNNDLEEYLAKSPTTEDAFRALERERDPEAAAAAVAALSEQEATPAIIEPEAPVAIPEPEAPLAAPPPEVEVIIPENTFPEADPEEDLPQAIVEREAEPAVTPISEAVAPTPAPQAPAVEQEAKLVDQRLSLITLGVTDLTRSRQFYEAVGWKQVARNKYDSIVFFQLNGMVLSLYPLNDLLSDQNLNGLATVPGGITLGINTRTKEEVNAYYQLFLSVGGKSLKAPDEMPWGAVTCYVADPDGHPWEISWVPQMQVDNDGDLWLR
jgi:predicted lactoylglutathione lyase